LFGNLEEKRPLGRTRRRWKDNVRMDVREIGWEDGDWIHMAQDRGPVVGCCGHGDELSGSIKDVEFLD
jgi:hypothetical protein